MHIFIPKGNKFLHYVSFRRFSTFSSWFRYTYW